MTIAKPGEIRSLTGLRGVAALLVVFFHFEIMYNGLSWSWTPIQTFIGHGYLAVDLFFVLSGYVMALTHSGDFSRGFTWAATALFLFKRAGRIYPLYFFMTVICFGLACIGIDDQIHGIMHNTAKLAINILLLQSLGGSSSLDHPAWSISTEMFAYGFFPVACAVLLNGRARTAWFVALGCLAIIIALVFVPESWSTGGRVMRRAWLDFPDTHTPFAMLRCFAEFGLGMLAWRLRNTNFGLRVCNSDRAGAILTSVILLLLALPDTDVAVVALIPALVLSLSKDRSPAAWVLGRPVFHVLGVLSYSIYLVHFPIYSVIIQSRLAVLLTHSEMAWLGIALTLSIAVVTYAIIEKPGRNYSRALLARYSIMPMFAAVETGAKP